MGKEHLKQLKDRDPAKRKAAIHAVARDLNRDALKPLAIMVKDDPDEDLRQLARRAGVYIREKLGDLPPAPAPAEAEKSNGKSAKGEHPTKIVVTEDDIKRAKGMLDSAVNYQVNGENAKAIKYLSQAIKSDPNLRHDPYFINVVQTVTGLEGEEGLANLGNVMIQKDYIDKESRQKLQKQIDEHNTRIQKATWADIGFDFGVMAMILLVGVTLLLFLNVEIAKGYVNKVEANRIMVDDAIAEGRIADPAADPRVYLSTEVDSSNQPIRFTEIVPDTQLWTTANQLKVWTMGEILPLALVITLGAMVGIAVTVGLAHLLATALRGTGRLPYLGHQMGSALNSRLLTLLIVAGIGSIIIYEFNGGTIVMIIAGVLGIIALLGVFRLIKVVSAAYNVGFAQGLIALLPGIALAAGVIVLQVL